MLLSIEPDGPVPIYQQIRDRIVEAIADGQLPTGSGLPATRQLAVDLGIPGPAGNRTGRVGCGRCSPRPPPRRNDIAGQEVGHGPMMTPPPVWVWPVGSLSVTSVAGVA